MEEMSHQVCTVVTGLRQALVSTMLEKMISQLEYMMIIVSRIFDNGGILAAKKYPPQNCHMLERFKKFVGPKVDVPDAHPSLILISYFRRFSQDALC